MLLESSVKGAFYVTQKNVVDVLILLYFIELIQQQQEERFNNLPQRVSRAFSISQTFSISTNEFPTEVLFPIGIVNFYLNASIFIRWWKIK